MACYLTTIFGNTWKTSSRSGTEAWTADFKEPSAPPPLPRAILAEACSPIAKVNGESAVEIRRSTW